MKKYDVAIIGSGPAGIMAAITASENGRHVVLIEKNPQIGRKLLATGNGRCNLTNKYVAVEKYHGSSPEFIETVINQFDQNAVMKFFQDIGLVLKEEDNGRIFPRTNQASSVVEVLKHRLARNNVYIKLESEVRTIEKSDFWKTILIDGESIQSDKLIITTGGRASHHFGSTGDGLHWARKLGHTYAPIYAALVPVETVETWPKDTQGVRIEADVWSTSNGRTIYKSNGDVLFTSYGVSGLAVMAQAGNIAPTLKTSQVELHIDMFPDFTEEQLELTVKNIFQNDNKKTFKDALIGILPSSMIPVIIRIAEFDKLKMASEISTAECMDIVRTVKNLTLTVSKLRPLKEAYVTSGGINADEINAKSLESKLVKGLYFAGEIIDVDGDSGGFNLQWAWSSGHAAGMNC